MLKVKSNSRREDFERLFRLDWDSVEIEREVLERGPELTPYLGSLEGLRVMRQSDPEETFFTFLCTPNNHIKRIAGMVGQLASYGPVAGEFGGIEFHRFPSVEVIASIPEEDLRAKGFGYRGATIPNAARYALSKGPDYLTSLKKEPYEVAQRALCEVPGVGPKLADCICLFGLDHTEAVPIDTHIWQAATRLYFPEWQGKALTDMKYRQVSAFFRDRFGELAGWAHQYLFFDNVLNWRDRK